MYNTLKFDRCDQHNMYTHIHYYLSGCPWYMSILCVVPLFVSMFFPDVCFVPQG